MKKSLLFESVLDTIKGDIANGKLKPGDQLPPISQLSQELQVSQGSVREAYRILDQMNVLEVQQGKGTFVSQGFGSGNGVLRQLQLAEHTTRAHLLEARKMLEPRIASLATQRATESEVAGILAAVQQVERELPTAEEWLEVNLKFHDLIVAAAHNPVVAQMLAAVRDLIREAHPLSPQTDEDRQLAIQHHKLIALAIQQRNPDAAQAFMHQHIETFEQEAVQSRERAQRAEKVN